MRLAEIGWGLSGAIADGEGRGEHSRDGEPLGVVLELVRWGGGGGCGSSSVDWGYFAELEEFPSGEAFVQREEADGCVGYSGRYGLTWDGLGLLLRTGKRGRELGAKGLSGVLVGRRCFRG